MKHRKLLVTIFYFLIGGILIFSIDKINETKQSEQLKNQLTTLEEIIEKRDFKDLADLNMLENRTQKVEVLNANGKTVFPKTNELIETEDIANLKKGSYTAKLITDNTITYSTKIIRDNKTIGFLRLSEDRVSSQALKMIVLLSLIALYLVYLVNLYLSQKEKHREMESILENERQNLLQFEEDIIEESESTEILIDSYIEFSKALHIPSFIYNQKGKIIQANHAIYRTFPEFYRSIDYFSLEAEFLNLLVNQLIEPYHLHRHLEFTKINRFFKVTLSPINEENFFVLLEDQTEIVEMIEKQNEFSANVAHELKTPIASIIGFSENLLENCDTKADIQTFANIINQEANRLNELISDIISLSKNHQHIKKSDIKIPEFIDSIISPYQKIIDQKNIDLTISSDNFVIRSKERLLQLIFKNLIENAIYYTEENGKIAIDVNLTKHNLQFIIADTGIGMSELNQKQIFDRFFRVDNTKSKNNNGTGLGLAIVKSYLTELGGHVEVESQLDVGSKFIATIPVK